MKISVLGTGSWGLAAGMQFLENGHELSYWTNSEEECELLKNEQRHEKKLPGVKLPTGFRYDTDMEKVLDRSEIVVFAVPSQFFRSVARQVSGSSLPKGAFVVSLTKGIEQKSLKRMSQVFLEENSGFKESRVAVLSGPSHAEEVAEKIATSLVIASSGLQTARKLQVAFNTPSFRIYDSDDVLGVELCASLKNVIAIAAGVLDGLGLGDNTKGALLTRGLAEISRLGERMGAQMRTFFGLAGMGDLITTCTSRHSRNRFVGERIGQGQKLEAILDSMTMVAEGVPTCVSGYRLSQEFEVEMPITQAVYQVLFENKSPDLALGELMSRNPKSEFF